MIPPSERSFHRGDCGIIDDVRLFFCVDLEERAKERLGRMIQELKVRCGQGKWVPPQNLHLTLRFLGEVDEGKVGELRELAHRVAARFAPFHMRLGSLGAFPAPGRARVIWLGALEGGEEFVRLATAMEEEVRKLGFKPETKEPKPHVTLARFKRPRDLGGSLQGVKPEPLSIEVREITLMRSTLRPEGPIYTPLFRVPLGGG